MTDVQKIWLDRMIEWERRRMEKEHSMSKLEGTARKVFGTGIRRRRYG